MSAEADLRDALTQMIELGDLMADKLVFDGDDESGRLSARWDRLVSELETEYPHLLRRTNT